VVTVIVAFPTLIASTFPFSSTVATDSLLELQVTFLLVAYDGKTVAVSLSVSPRPNIKILTFNLTL